MDWLWEVCKEGYRAIIYFSGYGDVEKKSLTQPGFLLCWDAPARVYRAGGAFALPMPQEAGRYLADQVSNQVASYRQVPMAVDNRNEDLTDVGKK